MDLNEQIKAVQREIAMRKVVYPKRIAIGKMKPEAAEHEIAAMQAVLETLQSESELMRNRVDSVREECAKQCERRASSLTEAYGVANQCAIDIRSRIAERAEK